MMEEFTVRQIAELLKVSKPTVQKIINGLEIKPSRIDEENRRYYDLESAERIIKERDTNFDLSILRQAEKFGEKAPSEPPKLAPSGEKFGEKPPSGEKSEEVELLRQALDIIKAQLEEKDKQLAVKDKQIEDLSNRLAEAMQLTRGQQYIAAADKTTELLEADKNNTAVKNAEAPVESGERAAASAMNIDEPQPQKKQSFWKKLFGK